MAQTQAKASTKATASPSIPAPGDGPVTKKPSLAERFRAKAKPATKTVKEKDRPTIDLPDEIVDLLKEYAPLKQIFDLVDKRNKREKKAINAAIWPLYVKALWQKKSQPKNPGIEIKGENGKVDITAMFQVNTGSKIKINMPSCSEDQEPDEVFVEALVDAGLEEQDAINLVQKEIDFTPQWSVDFTALLTSKNDKEREAAEKLFTHLQGEDAEGNSIPSDTPLVFTPEELNYLQCHINGRCKFQARLTDGDNFLDRVCDYAHSAEQLETILAFITPEFFINRTKFGVSDDPATCNERLIEMAATMLGAELGTGNDEE